MQEYILKDMLAEVDFSKYAKAQIKHFGNREGFFEFTIDESNFDIMQVNENHQVLQIRHKSDNYSLITFYLYPMHYTIHPKDWLNIYITGSEKLKQSELLEAKDFYYSEGIIREAVLKSTMDNQTCLIRLKAIPFGPYMLFVQAIGSFDLYPDYQEALEVLFETIRPLNEDANKYMYLDLPPSISQIPQPYGWNINKMVDEGGFWEFTGKMNENSSPLLMRVEFFPIDEIDLKTDFYKIIISMQGANFKLQTDSFSFFPLEDEEARSVYEEKEVEIYMGVIEGTNRNGQPVECRGRYVKYKGGIIRIFSMSPTADADYLSWAIAQNATDIQTTKIIL